MKKKIVERQCSICCLGRTDDTDLGTNDYWCGYKLELGSKKCIEKFELIRLFEGFKVK